MTQARRHHHDHHGSHHHAGCGHLSSACHGSTSDSTRLAWALVIIAGFACVEVVGSALSGSLALLADAGHMVTDAAAIALALWARHLAKAPLTAKLPYGQKRAQVLAAFVNGLALFVLIAFLLRESVVRLSNPLEIDAMTMLGVACLGLVANGVAFLILHSGDRTDINMRGALLHVVGDMLGSVAAIVSAIIISMTGWFAIDPLVTILVCLLIARSAYSLVMDAAHVLLQGAPKGLDTDELGAAFLKNIPAFESVHDLKVWMLTPGSAQLTMHARVADISCANVALSDAKKWLAEHYDIHDSIIQIEAVEPQNNVADSASFTVTDCPDIEIKAAAKHRKTFRPLGLH